MTPTARTSRSSASPAVSRPWRGVSAAERVAQRRQRLLDAGLELFGTRGIAGVTVEHVCAEAGLTKRYFYESFPSIDALVEAVVDDAVGRIVAVVLPILADRGLLDARPAATALIEAVLSDARLVRLLVVETYSGGLLGYRQRLIDRAIDLWMATARQQIDGTIDPVRVRFLAYAVAGAIGELTAAWLDGRLTLAPDQIADWLLDLYEQLAAPAISSFLTVEHPPAHP
jgi:AcrR family transcriptional regulator